MAYLVPVNLVPVNLVNYIYILHPTEFVVLCTVLITELLYGLTENGTVGPGLFFFCCAKKVFWRSFVVKPAFHTSYKIVTPTRVLL